MSKSMDGQAVRYVWGTESIEDGVASFTLILLYTHPVKASHPRRSEQGPCACPPPLAGACPPPPAGKEQRRIAAKRMWTAHPSPLRVWSNTDVERQWGKADSGALGSKLGEGAWTSWWILARMAQSPRGQRVAGDSEGRLWPRAGKVCSLYTFSQPALSGDPWGCGD